MLSVATLITRVQEIIADIGNTLWDASAMLQTVNMAKDEVYDLISNLRSNWGVKNTTSLSFAANSTTCQLPTDFAELLECWRVVSVNETVLMEYVPLSEIEKPVGVFRIATYQDSTGQGSSQQWWLQRPIINKTEAWPLSINYLPTLADQTALGAGWIQLGPMLERLIVVKSVRECLAARKPKTVPLWDSRIAKLEMDIADKVDNKSSARYVNVIE
jgi:hypothetical protein